MGWAFLEIERGILRGKHGVCADVLLRPSSPTPPHSFHLKVAGHPSVAARIAVSGLCLNGESGECSAEGS